MAPHIESKAKAIIQDIRRGHDNDHSPSAPARHPANLISGIRRAFYGWFPDLPDPRDQILSFREATVLSLPSAIDLRPLCPPVYDQGKIGSCTANALAGMVAFMRARERLPPLAPSRLFIYYNERVIENSVPSDAGAALRDGMKSVARQGACDEADWPYDDTPADASGNFPAGCRAVTCPSAALYTAALEDRAVAYKRVLQLAEQMKACLSDGYPFVAGFTVFSGFESEETASTGVADMPNLLLERPVGGHAVLVVGYDDATSRFLCRNSWGPQWGMEGYFTIPYAYFCNPALASDFWTIRLV